MIELLSSCDQLKYHSASQWWWWWFWGPAIEVSRVQELFFFVEWPFGQNTTSTDLYLDILWPIYFPIIDHKSFIALALQSRWISRGLKFWFKYFSTRYQRYCETFKISSIHVIVHAIWMLSTLGTLGTLSTSIIISSAARFWEKKTEERRFLLDFVYIFWPNFIRTIPKRPFFWSIR